MSTKQQGNVGMGKAISYYTELGCIVSIPLNDSQKYDLVIDAGDGLKKVQVKTTRYKNKDGVYEVLLKTTGGTKGCDITRFDGTQVDVLFVYTMEGSIYIIPSIEVKAGCGINLGKKYEQYKV